ncbi:MAG: YraN family protein [Candidatus Limnocylindrales bacterium]
MTSAAKRLGDAAEATVLGHLEAAGWAVLATNVRVGRDELDLVAIDPGPPAALVVVEVRWRGSREFGLPEETFDHGKRRRTWRAVATLIDRGRLPDGRALPALPVRVDLVVVEPPNAAGGPLRIRHHRAALGR